MSTSQSSCARASKQMESQNESDKEEEDGGGGEESSTFLPLSGMQAPPQPIIGDAMEGGVIPKRDSLMMMHAESEKESGASSRLRGKMFSPSEEFHSRSTTCSSVLLRMI